MPLVSADLEASLEDLMTTPGSTASACASLAASVASAMR